MEKKQNSKIHETARLPEQKAKEECFSFLVPIYLKQFKNYVNSANIDKQIIYFNTNAKAKWKNENKLNVRFICDCSLPYKQKI